MISPAGKTTPTLDKTPPARRESRRKAFYSGCFPGTSASVNLKKGLVTVSMEAPVDGRVVVAAIEKHGYKVV